MASALQLAPGLKYEHIRSREVLREGEAPQSIEEVIGAIRLKKQDFSAREVLGAEGTFFEGKTRFIGKRPFKSISRKPFQPPPVDQSMGQAEQGGIVMGGRTRDRGEPVKLHGAIVRKGDKFRRNGREFEVVQIQELYPNEAAGVLRPALRYICDEVT